MRKRIIGEEAAPLPHEPSEWLDLEHLAEVEITSEDPNHPIEDALLGKPGTGWRAAGPGPQTLRLLFAEPQAISKVHLHFIETELARTQEYVLHGAPDLGGPRQEIVRQQWNFSPDGTTEQIEVHAVEMPALRVLELKLIPDTNRGPAIASLAALRLA